MPQYTLTVVDTSGIQNYVFHSNTLKHIIGASEIVQQATQEWVYQTLNELGKTNVDHAGKITETLAITGDDLNSELIYAGGGNAVIIFKTEEIAQDFTRRISRHVLATAPGLELIIKHAPFVEGQTPLKEAVRDTFSALREKKRHRHWSTPLLGLSVTATCQFTDMPAVDEDEDERRISAEIAAKLAFEPKGHDRLTKYWPPDYSVPKDFDHFGRTKEESSYLAIVHADGNQMGKRVKKIADEYAPTDQDYLREMRRFSKAVKEKSEASLRATINALVGRVKDGKIDDIIELEWDQKEQKYFLPFRPLIFGGDDLTFVCEGRLGVSLAAFYLHHFTTQHKFPPDNTPIYVRAGAAIVKTHYPFAQAYHLAEALANNAKPYMDKNHKQMSVLDWHFAVSGLLSDLAEIRERDYIVKVGNLTMRPVRVIGDAPDWQSWQTFSQIVTEFQKQANVGKRSIIKALHEALRGGEAQVKAFLENHAYQLPTPPEFSKRTHLPKTGWDGRNCGYFDAVEAMDFFIPLEMEGQSS